MKVVGMTFTPKNKQNFGHLEICSSTNSPTRQMRPHAKTSADPPQIPTTILQQKLNLYQFRHKGQGPAAEPCRRLPPIGLVLGSVSCKSTSHTFNLKLLTICKDLDHTKEISTTREAPCQMLNIPKSIEIGEFQTGRDEYIWLKETRVTSNLDPYHLLQS